MVSLENLLPPSIVFFETAMMLRTATVDVSRWIWGDAYDKKQNHRAESRFLSQHFTRTHR